MAELRDRPPDPPSLEELERQVEQKWEEDRRGALRFEAKNLQRPYLERQREWDRQDRARQKQERERAEAEKIARKAWRKVFGRQVAGELEPFAEYAILPLEGRFIIVLEGAAEACKKLIADAGVAGTGQEHRGILGVHLTKYLGKQDLAGLNPEPEAIRRVGQRKREAEEQERERRIVRDQAESRRQREAALVGEHAVD